MTGREVADLEAMEAAARELHALGPQLVIVKGGRRRDAEAVDVAFDGRCVTLLRAPWIDTAERPRHRMHVLGGDRGQPRPRARAARGRVRGQAVRHPGHPRAARVGTSVPATGLLDQLGAAAAQARDG